MKPFFRPSWIAALASIIGLACATPPTPLPLGGATPRASPTGTVARSNAVRVTGAVVDEHGRPIAGAHVAAVFDLEPERGDEPFVVATDGEGRFVYPDLPPGKYAFTATADHGAPAYSGLVEVAAGMSSNLELRLGAAGTELSGTVTDEEGKLGGSALVALIEISPRDRSFFVTRVGSDGRYQVGIDPERRYVVYVSASPRANLYRVLEPNDRMVDLHPGPLPRPRPSDAELTGWLSTNAIPIRSDDPSMGLDDLAPLEKAIGRADVVALGEATHGSREIFRMKHRLLRMLVEKKGFRVLAIEAGEGECEAVNAYVQGGKGDAKTVIRGLITDNLETDEIVELVEWLRRYNQGHVTQKVTFAGFDVSSVASTDAVIAYLRKVEPERADGFAELFKPFVSDGFDTVYGSMKPEQQKKVRGGLDELRRLFGFKYHEYIAKTGHAAYSKADGQVWDLDEAERTYRDPILRDAFMAHNVIQIEHATLGKVVVWAHNAHVGKNAYSFQDMGHRLSEFYGRNYFVIGTAFGHGGFRALGPERVAPAKTFEVVNPIPSGFDAALGLAKKPIFAIDLSTASGKVAEWLDSPVPAWSVGFAFNGEDTARRTFSPRKSFDAVVYIDQVTAAHAFRQ